MGRRAKRNASRKVSAFLARTRGHDVARGVETAAQLVAIGRQRIGEEFYAASQWGAADLIRLERLAAADADPHVSAAALLRTPTSLAWQAKERGIRLPSSWRALIRPPSKPRAPRIEIAYPYIQKVRPEHGDLLRANALVPRGLPEHMRADICQSVMLALYEGRTALADLEANTANLRWFVHQFYETQRPWQEITGIGGEDDDRDYTDIALARSVWRTYTSEDETFDYVYEREIDRAHEAALAGGVYREREEIEQELSQRSAARSGRQFCQGACDGDYALAESRHEHTGGGGNPDQARRRDARKVRWLSLSVGERA